MLVEPAVTAGELCSPLTEGPESSGAADPPHAAAATNNNAAKNAVERTNRGGLGNNFRFITDPSFL